MPKENDTVSMEIQKDPNQMNNLSCSTDSINPLEMDLVIILSIKNSNYCSVEKQR